MLGWLALRKKDNRARITFTTPGSAARVTLAPMPFPITPPLLPMLAKRIDAIPATPGLQFEPKWDGFRTILFRDGDDLLIQSRDGKPLDRYFPELREPLLAQLPQRCVLDGEIVIARTAHRTREAQDGEIVIARNTNEGTALDSGRTILDFDALQLRIHPAASRIKLLAQQTPASVVFFDLIALDNGEGGRDLQQTPFAERRRELERILADAKPPLHLTPATQDIAIAQDWFQRFEGAGLDGLIAKPLDGLYAPDKRTQFKVKHERDCDCVVAGFRWHKNGEGTLVGSLLLGLFNDAGALQHVGVCASFTARKREELVATLAPYRENALENHPWANWSGSDTDTTTTNSEQRGAGDAEQRMPGAKSRWKQHKDLSWMPLRPELVVEVAYEHMQGNRFRHLAHFRRWRTDKAPAACTYAQLEVVPPQELLELFGR